MIFFFVLSCQKENLTNVNKTDVDDVSVFDESTDTVFDADNSLLTEGSILKATSSCLGEISITYRKKCIDTDAYSDFRLEFGINPTPYDEDYYNIDWILNGSQHFTSTDGNIEVNFYYPFQSSYSMSVVATFKDPATGIIMDYHDCIQFTLPPAGKMYVCAGSQKDLDEYRSPEPFTLPSGYGPNDVIDMATDYTNDYNFVWFKNGKVSAGTTHDLDAFRTPYSYTLPSGYTTSMIVALCLDGNSDQTYAYYNNFKFSIGSTSDLDKFQGPKSYTLPSGYTPNDIVGMARDGKENFTYVYFDDGKTCSGKPEDLDYFRPLENYSLPCGYSNINDIIGISEDGDDDYHFVWFRN